MQLRDIVHEWVSKAKRDAESAQFLLDMFPPPLEIIGFHAEQAVEKSLKAVIVSKGIDPPRTHDLVFLHQRCVEQVGFDFEQTELCARLTPYAVDQRYPTEMVIDETDLLQDVTAAVAFTREIREKLVGTAPSSGQLSDKTAR